ncbi:MAG: putative lipid II flippase FtsW [Pseudomonadota bacterium]
MIRQVKAKKYQPIKLDPTILFSSTALLLIGLIMVGSTSIIISEKQFHGPFHFLIRQLLYFCFGLSMCWVVLQIPMQTWRKLSFPLLISIYLLLLLVLLPGIGREVNGSTRWISMGPLTLQVSEVIKFFVIIFLADYLTRREQEVQNSIYAFIKPLFLLGIMALLLLKEPDFGAVAVIFATALMLFFLAGVRIWQFIALFVIISLALFVLAVTSPYRLARLTTFLNPWAHEFSSGYQLTQSLIAFGRGGWFGVGLGDSIQKLFYLPEAHTDFLFAIFAEEIGLIGVFCVIVLYCTFFLRALWIGHKAYKSNNKFNAYIAYGLGLWMAMQALINMGVNAGVLPTKGLTLPFMSYGGSSMLMSMVVVGILLRIHYEITPTQAHRC